MYDADTCRREVSTDGLRSSDERRSTRERRSTHGRRSSDERRATDEGRSSERGSRDDRRERPTPRSGSTRRQLLAAIGTGVATAGLAGWATTGAAQDAEEPAERVYAACHRFTVSYGVLPADVQSEVDAALASGAYESASPPLFAQAVDVDRSYLSHDGTYYEATVEEREDGYALSLEATTPIVPEPETLVLRNRSDSAQTVSVRVEDEDPEDVLFEDEPTVDPGEEVAFVEHDEFGNYTVVAATDAGEREFTWSLDAIGDDPRLTVTEDGVTGLSQAVRDVLPCEFAFETPTLRVETAGAVAPGSTLEADLVLSEAPTGISEFDVEAAIQSGSSLETVVQDVAVGDSFEPIEVPTPDDAADSARVRAAVPEGTEPEQYADLRLATVTIGVEQAGSRADDAADGDATVTVEAVANWILDYDGYRLPVNVEGSTSRCGDGAAESATVDGRTVCDVNDDGHFRDVDGDGAVGQGDVAEFFTRQHRSEWKQPGLFDFSENGAVTHGDVVELFDYVALQ